MTCKLKFYKRVLENFETEVIRCQFMLFYARKGLIQDTFIIIQHLGNSVQRQHAIFVGKRAGK